MKFSRFRSNILNMLTVCTLAFTATSANAAQLLVNGSFNAGLSGWTAFTTANGTIGTPAVVAFDVTGAGIQNAAQFQAGQVVFGGFGSPPEGGGLFQIFNSAAGVATFTASIAAFSPGGNNASAGVFSILLNGSVLQTIDLSFIESGAINRGQFNFSTLLTAGVNRLDIQVGRPFLSDSGTPFQYFTNVSLVQSVAVVPEPATWALLIVGFGLVGVTARRRRSIAVLRVVAGV